MKYLFAFFLMLSNAAFGAETPDNRRMELEISCQDMGLIEDRTSDISKKGVITVRGKNFKGEYVKIVFPLAFFRNHGHDPFTFFYDVKYERDGRTTMMTVSCESDDDNIVSEVLIKPLVIHDEELDFQPVPKKD